jgi:hypothetical protein
MTRSFPMNFTTPGAKENYKSEKIRRERRAMRAKKLLTVMANNGSRKMDDQCHSKASKEATT